ncbi:MAG: FecR family protein [Opitutaceae bacterium]|nr:FecR family protein [Opitutaceae bacterium]
MKPIRTCLLVFATVALGLVTRAATNFESAVLTFVQHDVSVAELDLIEVDATGRIVRRPAALDQSVPDNQAVLTGRKSRAEITLNDGTIARVGQLSSFTYGKGTRLLQLKQGSALFVVPPGLGGTSVQAGAVTAAITGTTLLAQVFADRVVIYVYEGTVEVAGLSVGAGQFATIPNAGAPSLANFNVARGIDTAALFSKFYDAGSQQQVMRRIGPAVGRSFSRPAGVPEDVGDKTVVNPRVNTPHHPAPAKPDDNYSTDT